MEKNRNEEPVMGTQIELFTLMHDILKNIVFIILGGLAAAMFAYVFVNISYVPQYTTSTTFVVGSQGSNNTYANLNAANTMATTFQKVLESKVMRETIREEMGVDAITATIKAEVLEGTNLLVLSVTDHTAKDAIDVIRIVMETYSDVAIYAVGDAVMTILEEPEVPYEVGNPIHVTEVVKKGFLTGLAICIFLFGLLSYMRNSVKQEEEVEKKLDARSLGAISFEYKNKTLRDLIKREKKAVLVDSPVSSFPFVESYKKLASKVEYQLAKTGGKSLVITSVSENEGKSTVAANLAITLADQGKKVVLIDGDIRRPSQFLILGIEPKENSEIGEFLKKSGNTLQNVMRKTNRKGLFFLGGRNCYSTSTEILHSDYLPKMMEACRKYADYVIIDTPPAGLLGDAALFAQSADAVLLVVRQNFMLAEDVNDILDDFRDNHAKVLGVVLNGVQTFTGVVDGTAGGRYGHYGHYGHYSRKRG